MLWTWKLELQQLMYWWAYKEQKQLSSYAITENNKISICCTISICWSWINSKCCVLILLTYKQIHLILTKKKKKVRVWICCTQQTLAETLFLLDSQTNAYFLSRMLSQVFRLWAVDTVRKLAKKEMIWLTAECMACE